MLKIARIEHKLRPFMARSLTPKFFMELYSANRRHFIASMSKTLKKPISNAQHPSEVCGINFRNDLGNAAGLDKDGSLLEFNYCLGAGFAVVGTVLNKPHTGNILKIRGKEHNPWVPLPHSHSALNSLGLPSLGVDAALENILKFKEKYPDPNFPVGLSIMGHPLQKDQEKLDGILECVSKAVGKVEFIEINESCPNVKHSSDDDLESRLQAISKIKGTTPIFVKLGDLGDANKTVKLLDQCQIDGLVLLNTQKNYHKYRPQLAKQDHKIFDYYTEKFQGGLSGEIIRDTSFDSVREAHAAIKENNSKLQLIHVGGINTSSDMKESREFAPLREWYTGLMEHMGTKKLRDVYAHMVNP
jgi:dihydroorotate dehydrogenase